MLSVFFVDTDGLCTNLKQPFSLMHSKLQPFWWPWQPKFQLKKDDQQTKKKLKSLSMFGETIKHTNLGNATWSFLPLVWWFFYYYGDHLTAEAFPKATFWKRELGALSYERYLRYMYLLSWHVQELRQMIHTMHNISSDFPLKAKSLQLFFISDVCKYKRWICFSSVWYWRYVHVAVQFLDFIKFAFWNFQMIDLPFFSFTCMSSWDRRFCMWGLLL